MRRKRKARTGQRKGFQEIGTGIAIEFITYAVGV